MKGNFNGTYLKKKQRKHLQINMNCFNSVTPSKGVYSKYPVLIVSNLVILLMILE